MIPAHYNAASVARDILADRRLLRTFLAPTAGEQIALGGLVGILTVSAVYLVYATGGTMYAYLHVAYIPVAMAALVFGVWGGVATGALIGLALGPFMPLNVATDLQQPLWGWLFRAATFVFAGFVAGGVFSILRHAVGETLCRGYLDTLTSLPNEQYMARVLGTMVRAHASVAIFVVNLGAFRSVAAAFGTRVTDEMLRRVVERLRAALPPDSLVFRLHGGQFGIITPAVDAEAFVGPILEALAQPVEALGIPLPLDATIGTTPVAEPPDGIEAVIRQAAVAAEDAREQGREWQAFAAETEADRKERIHLLADVREALATGQLHLHYQPKVRLSDGVMVGCEALVRWTHPERGPVPPGRFVPVVEQSSLIGRLTEFVLYGALGQAAAWERLGLDIVMSVNASARDISDDALMDRLLGIIRDSGVRPELIDIEITESAAFRRDADVARNLRRLRDCGVSLSIDDYGTGMSSLAYLKQIPATYLKIDQMFIRNVARHEDDRVMVDSTLQMCRRMGIVSLAEGVEDQECAALLRSLGCEQAQGYHFARPTTADGTLDYYRRSVARAAQRPLIRRGQAPIPAEPPFGSTRP